MRVQKTKLMTKCFPVHPSALTPCSSPPPPPPQAQPGAVQADIQMHSFTNGSSTASKADNWDQLARFFIRALSQVGAGVGALLFVVPPRHVVRCKPLEPSKLHACY
jgi:hypothetical protein